MKNIKEKVVAIVIIALSIMFMGINSYAHSGRTDSSGGHKDNKNKSGLGSYHYHCGGHPAHLHSNGVCPYSSNSKKSTSTTTSSKKSSSSKKSNSSSSNSSSTKSTTSTPEVTPTAPVTITATGIEINEKIEDMKVGDNKNLTATITPSNVTDKTITWKSSDESIAIVSTAGNVTAKAAGIVEITASTSNGKTSAVKISITEEKKESRSEATKTLTINTNNTNSINNVNDSIDDNSGNSNIAGTITGLGLLGSGGYWVYKKLKE